MFEKVDKTINPMSKSGRTEEVKFERSRVSRVGASGEGEGRPDHSKSFQGRTEPPRPSSMQTLDRGKRT